MVLTLQAATKHIGRVVSRMPRAEVMPLLQPHLLAGLFEAFKHASADVRKATVFCLVDLWLVSCPHCAPGAVQLAQTLSPASSLHALHCVMLNMRYRGSNQTQCIFVLTRPLLC